VYSGDLGFESRSGDRLSSLSFFLFLSPAKQIFG